MLDLCDVGSLIGWFEPTLPPAVFRAADLDSSMKSKLLKINYMN